MQFALSEVDSSIKFQFYTIKLKKTARQTGITRANFDGLSV